MNQDGRFTRGGRGFTLLEVLVVLVLVGLIMTVLMQGVLYTLRLRAQFLLQQRHFQEDFLPESWFRGSSAALVPASSDSPQVFQGDREGFQGLSLMPLLSAPGVPSPIEWRLTVDDGRRLLQYRQDHQENAVVIFTWPEAARTEFAYLDEQGNWSERWPPAAATVAGAPPAQLPAAVRLQIRVEEQGGLWLVPIVGRRDPPIDPFAEPPAPW